MLSRPFFLSARMLKEPDEEMQGHANEYCKFPAGNLALHFFVSEKKIIKKF